MDRMAASESMAYIDPSDVEYAGSISEVSETSNEG